jgi:hypothetical protein
LEILGFMIIVEIEVGDKKEFLVVSDVLSLERTIDDLAMQRQWSACCLSCRVYNMLPYCRTVPTLPQRTYSNEALLLRSSLLVVSCSSVLHELCDARHARRAQLAGIELPFWYCTSTTCSVLVELANKPRTNDRESLAKIWQHS